MPDETLPYRIRQDFLSPAETAFYRVLDRIFRDRAYICPKVSLQDLFFVVRPNENVHYFNKIYRKTVDFLVLNRVSLRPALAVELDNTDRSRAADLFLDQVFAAAKVPIVHVMIQPQYEVKRLATQFRDAMLVLRGEDPLDRATDYSPVCPRCGITMVLRVHRAGPKAGQQYYGCLNFPECREMIPVTEVRGK
jgi:hypothetical protein